MTKSETMTPYAVLTENTMVFRLRPRNALNFFKMSLKRHEIVTVFIRPTVCRTNTRQGAHEKDPYLSYLNCNQLKKRKPSDKQQTPVDRISFEPEDDPSAASSVGLVPTDDDPQLPTVVPVRPKPKPRKPRNSNVTQCFDNYALKRCCRYRAMVQMIEYILCFLESLHVRQTRRL